MLSLNKLARAFLTWNLCYILLIETFLWIIASSLSIHISGLHKLALILFTFFCLFLSSRRYVIFALVLCVPFFISSFRFSSFNTLIENYSEAFRLISLFPMFFFLVDEIKKGRINESFYYRLIWISFFVISVNLLLGALGLGTAQRAGGVGTRGFFNAGNDISTLTGIIASFILSFYWDKSKWKFILIAFYFLFLAYLLNTKAILAGMLMIILLIPSYAQVARLVINFRISTREIYRLSRYLVILVLMLSLFIIVSFYTDFWGRYLTFYDQYQTDDLLTFVLSRRNQYAEDGMAFVREHFNTSHIFFGFGTGNFLELAKKRTELDVFDLFFFYGVIGLVLAYLFFLYFIFKSITTKKQDIRIYPLRRGLFSSNVFLFSMSIFAGHVFTSAIICLFLGITNSISFLKSDDK